ncbi:alginate export family protein [Corallincola platygyrae]|uniref:Alginate export family protein n=1 Tax=Corallincola platygyrae TaxID=1193278 RepID=A0ABW4XNW7_9GAMM
MQNIKSKLTTVAKLSPLAIAIGLASAPAHADLLEEIATGVTEGKTKLSFRYRYEFVDQDGKDKDANASTLKSRITFTTAPIRDFVVGVEADHVSEVGNDNFNSTENGKTEYPVVADPKGTDLNQAFLKYGGFESGTVTFGRQRIVHGSQRFMGGVAWRQNEQTYDGARVEYGFTDALSADVSYIWNVNRIFGPDGADSDLHGNIGAARLTYDAGAIGKFTAYDYYLDFDNNDGLSSNTIGIEYAGGYALSDTTKLGLKAAYAMQEDTGDNPNSYEADYYTVEGSVKFAPVSVSVGYEVLGADDGVSFKTPLATLHKFQGFADKFLVTPPDGIQDTYIKVAGAVAGVKLAAFYHDFQSDEGSTDYGTEIDLVASYKINKHFGVLAKYASYDADDHATDTDKVWLQLTANF